MKANTDTLQKQEEEKAFQYRSYGKGELAMLYIPNIQQQSAVDRFNEWIEAAPGLKNACYPPAWIPEADTTHPHKYDWS